MTRKMSAEFKRNRSQILEAYPTCYWCKRAPSTEVDHLIEADAGGTDDPDNLVGSCKPCNSRRGAEYLARKKTMAMQRRQNLNQPQNSKKTTDFFAKPTWDTPTPFHVSPPNAKDYADTDEIALIGRKEPRIQTYLPEGDTWGDDVVAWAKRVMGVEFFDWQVELLRNVMLRDPDPASAFSTFVRSAYWSCARQNGKTLMAQAVCGWFFTEMPKLREKPVTVIYAAHTMKVAISIFEDMGELLKEHYGATFRKGNGREEISLNTPWGRCKWYLVANKENAPRGFTADLIWIDEMQAFKSQTIAKGFQPTMTARNPTTANGFPLMLLTATAGDARSDFQLNYREQAFQSIEAGELSRSFMAEWSAPENLDWRLPSTWAWASPGLGQSVYLDYLEQCFKTMKRDEFIQEFLNVIKLTVNAWVQPDEWDKLEANAKLVGKRFLAVDSSVDDSRYVGVIAGEVNGKTHIQQAFLVGDEATMWEKIVEIMADTKVELLVTPSLHLHTPTNLISRAKTVGYAEILTYTGLVLKMIKEKQITHDGSAVVRTHILNAALVKTMNGVTLSSQKSAGPIEFARCAVWAASLASKPMAAERRPSFASGR